MKKILCYQCLKTRLSGQITVYASLSILLIISLISVCFKSAVLSYHKARIDAACSISIESVFANYSNTLLDEFDLFAVRNDLVQDQFQYLISQNLEFRTSDHIQLLSQEISNQKAMTDGGGYYLNAEVLDYMKYGMADELLQRIMNLDKQREQTKAIEQIGQTVSECTEKEVEINQHTWELISAIEGIRTTEDGMVINHGGPVSTGDHFVKALLTNEPSMKSTGIDSTEIYQIMAGGYGRYTNGVQLVDDMIDDVTQLQELQQLLTGGADGGTEAQLDEKELTMNDSDIQRDQQEYYSAYLNSYETLRTLVNDVRESISQAQNVIAKYDSSSSELSQVYDKCKQQISDNQMQLGSDLYQSFMDDIDGMADQDDGNKRSICNMDLVKDELNSRGEYLSLMNSMLAELQPEKNNIWNTQSITSLQKVKEYLLSFDNSRLKFDYSGIDFKHRYEGLGAVKKLISTMENGISALVLDGKMISDKEVTYSDLATDNKSNESAYKDTGIVEDVINNGIFSEYILEKFNSFTDYINKDDSVKTDTGKQLDYMVEYIICQENSDRDNLNETIMKLSGIREGINLAYLVMNAQKRNEAFAMAGTLLGFTGNMALIKAAQYLIMTAWAYGESIVDLKQLYQGKKIPLIKTDASWNLSLEKLMRMELNAGSEADRNDQDGIDYEQYLRALLLLQKRTDQYYGTMGAIELRMIELEKQDFRLRNYIVSATGTVSCYLTSIKSKYQRSLNFGYTT